MEVRVTVAAIGPVRAAVAAAVFGGPGGHVPDCRPCFPACQALNSSTWLVRAWNGVPRLYRFFWLGGVGLMPISSWNGVPVDALRLCTASARAPGCPSTGLSVFGQTVGRLGARSWILGGLVSGLVPPPSARAAPRRRRSAGLRTALRSVRIRRSLSGPALGFEGAVR